MNVPVQAADLNPSNLFDILAQPSLEDGFVYSWTNLTDLSGLPDGSEAFSLNGAVPCCVPLDGLRGLTVSVSGSTMGSCNMTSHTANFSLPSAGYQNARMPNGPRDAQALVVQRHLPSSQPSNHGQAPSMPSLSGQLTAMRICESASMKLLAAAGQVESIL